MGFYSQLHLTAMRGKNQYKLDEPLGFYRNYTGQFYNVPTGFITDFASIPFFLKFLIDDNDPHIRDAAVLHDYLYSKDCHIYGITRKKADFILWVAMGCLDSPEWKRRWVYKAVRAFGWLFYKG